MTAGRRILVVSYFYPPDLSVGGNRWSAMAHHLRSLGHEVTVLTTGAHGRLADDGDWVIRTTDLQASDTLRRVLRRPAREGHGGAGAKGGAIGAAAGPPPKLLNQGVVPDAHAVSWLPFAVKAARSIIGQRDIECVVTSAPPDSVALLPLMLGRSRPAWVADFRDGWRFEPLRGAWPTGAQDYIDSWMERRVARSAEIIIGATRPIAEDFEARFGARSAYVPNAWDPALEEAVAAESGSLELPKGGFNLVHTGGLSVGSVGRDPKWLFAAMRQLLDERGESARRLRLVLIGAREPECERLIDQIGVRELFEILGPQPRLKALAAQRAADALLLLTAPGYVSHASGKLCEYLVAGPPILALAEGNEAARIVAETGSGVAVAPDDVGAIADALGRLLDGKLAAGGRVDDELARYVYPAPALAVAELIEQAISRRSEGKSA
ncbi:MAG: glycosyltransferase [Solirubrobacterales bacterium]|nr:glycosyltransferase [Solirubrobacterales bacterium]